MKQYVRTGPHQYYKGDNFIVFYDETDEILKYMFDNAREILKFQNKEITRQNVNRVNAELYYALRRRGHETRFLDGRLLRVYIINLEKEYDF